MIENEIYNGEKRQFSMEQFIGIFPNAINDDLCSEFVKWFDEVSEQGLTMSAMQDSRSPGILRKDEVIHIPVGLPAKCFPSRYAQPLWDNIQECYSIYYNEYTIDRTLMSYSFKVHRVLPTGGYHAWHYEHTFNDPYRVLAWHLTLEAPKRGGETEFLYQSIRVEPKVGQLVIWPAGFTHQHRGNCPLEGQKTYMTGWFDVDVLTQQ